MELILVLFFIIFLIILFIWSYYFDNSKEPEILAYNKIMSDETKVTETEETKGVQMQSDSPVQVNEQSGPITTETDVNERIIKVLENQQILINKLSEAYNNSNTTINSLMGKINNMESKLVEHEKFLPEVIGDFNFDEKFSDLSTKDLDKMEKENRQLFNSIISRYRV